jgi:glycosyltransferase involved in cell wall biosynthesis
MPLKVLHISSGNLYGGVETLLATLARERGSCPETEPRFALCFEGRLSSKLSALATPATILGPARTRAPWTIAQARRKLCRAIEELRPDAGVCHMPWSLAMFGPVLTEMGVPLVFWMHDRAHGMHWIERWAGLRRPDFVICNSHFTAESAPRLFPQGVPPYEVLYYPVAAPENAAPSAEDALAVRGELKTAGDAVVIVQVSRMEPYKGHSLLLQALGRLAQFPDWVCWIVGGPQTRSQIGYLQRLQADAANAGISDRVRFVGERSDVGRLLDAADIFCQPNMRGEPFGIAFVEALYHRLPVVSTRIGGAVEIVDDSCGRLVEAGSPAHLAGALQDFIRDERLRTELGRGGPARARSICSPQSNLARLAVIIETCVRAEPRLNAAGPAALGTVSVR